jgi:hypothetical protein
MKVGLFRKSVLSIFLMVAAVVLFSVVSCSYDKSHTTAPFHATSLQFAVMSDSHIGKENEGPIFKAALAEIKKMNAASNLPIKYVVMNGDMTFNHATLNPLTPDQYQAELEKYFLLVSSGVQGTDIKFLINRGNHDGHFQNDLPDAMHAPYVAKYKEMLDKYNNLLAAYDYRQMNNHVILEGISFVKLDFAADPTVTADKVVDVAWLKSIKKDLRPRAIFIGHYPAFSSTSKGYAMGNSAAFLDYLAETGNRIYFSGHDHVFNHAVLEKKDASGKVIAAVQQFNAPDMVAGTFSRDWAKNHFAKQPGNWTARIAGPDAYLNKVQGFYIVKVTDQETEVTFHKYNKTAAGFEKGYRAVVAAAGAVHRDLAVVHPQTVEVGLAVGKETFLGHLVGREADAGDDARRVEGLF